MKHLLGLRWFFIFKQELKWLFRLRQEFKLFPLCRLELILFSLLISQLILALQRISQQALKSKRSPQQAPKQIFKQAPKQIFKQALLLSFQPQLTLFSILRLKRSFRLIWRLRLELQSHFILISHCSSKLQAESIPFQVMDYFIKPKELLHIIGISFGHYKDCCLFKHRQILIFLLSLQLALIQ